MATITATNNPLAKYFEEFPAEAPSGSSVPFHLRVCCVRRRPPRHEGWEYVREMGAANIPKAMKREPLSGELVFVFPERHLGVAEQQAFIWSIAENPAVAEITRLDIITSSPLIIGDCLREEVLILRFDDDEEYGCGNGA